jgi:hypothetical protein
MVKGTRNWKLKYEIKDLLFSAFHLKQNLKPVAEPTWITPAQVRESTLEGSNALQTV